MNAHGGIGGSSVTTMAPSEAFRIHREALTNWMNVRLAARGLFVGNLFTDLSDGRILKHLLEVITGESLEMMLANLLDPANDPQGAEKMAQIEAWTNNSTSVSIQANQFKEIRDGAGTSTSLNQASEPQKESLLACILRHF